MPHDPDFHETAATWLDGTGDSGAHRVLREILRDAPDSTMEFAALARTEAALQLAAFTPAERLHRARSLIQPSAATRFRRLTGRPAFRAAAAAIVLLAGAVWWFMSGGDESLTDPARPRIAPHVLRTKAPPLTMTTTPAEQLPPADKDFARRMSRFIIPEFKATGVPLAAALDTLRKDIAAIDDTAVPEFSAAPDLPDDRTVHLHLRYLPVAVLVDVMAIQTGTKFQMSEKGYLIAMDAKAPPPGELQDLSYRQGNIEQLPFGSGRWHEGSPPVYEYLADGLEKCLGEKPVKSGADPREANTGRVTASLRLHKMLRRLITAGAGTPPGTWIWIPKAVEITGTDSQAKFAELTGGKTSGVFNDPEFQMLMRGLSQMNGVDLMTFSPMVTPSGDGANSFVGTLGSDPTSVAIMSAQLGSLLKLQGEELIRGVLELGVQDSTIQKVYPEYLSGVAHLAELRKSGFGPRHPKVLRLKESIALMERQLTEAAETYKSNLKTQIENSKAMPADARVPTDRATDDWTGIRWTVENQTGGDSDSMFQWLLEVSEAVPGAPSARATSRGNGRLFDHQTMMVHCERTAEGKLRAFFVTGLENPPRQKVQAQDTPFLLSPPNPNSPPEPKENLPYGIPVEGKAGMVQSPYDPDKGLVDVTGLKRGTRVSCPYSGKHFRVP